MSSTPGLVWLSVEVTVNGPAPPAGSTVPLLLSTPATWPVPVSRPPLMVTRPVVPAFRMAPDATVVVPFDWVRVLTCSVPTLP